MDNENLNENKTPNTFDEEREKRMEKHLLYAHKAV